MFYCKDYIEYRLLKCHSVLSIKEQLTHLKPDVIFLDIDNTLIQPISITAQNGLIDTLKQEQKTIKKFEKMLSTWRLQRKIELIDKSWPEFIESLKKSFLVFGLTKMNMGRCGDIKNMESWRYEELKNHNIIFSKFNASHALSCEFGGVFYAQRNQTKGEIVDLFLKHVACHHIILVDDLIENLESVETTCKAHCLNFNGIHFCPEKKQHHKDVWDYQYKNLIKNHIWTEDEEVIQALRV